ncbi:MAG TPA: PrsW family glutamic-type intramembrane protease [Vicinamibacterales bacterium]
MLLAIIFYNVWGVLQLVAVGSFARTVRVRTVLAAIVVGLFLCAPLAVLLENALAGAFSALTGRSFHAVTTVAGYTVHPAIEEIIRVVPLALLLLVPVARRQLSVTDCVLIGAATGAGFGLAEDLFRFSSAPQQAVSVAGGWIAPFQTPYGPPSGIRVFVPSIGTALGSWLPDMGGVRLFAPYLLPNVLLIWSALTGLAVGLWLRLEGSSRWYVPIALLGYATCAHAASNADITMGRALAQTAPLRAIAAAEWLMPLVALAIAWRVDRRMQDAILPEHLLEAERQSPRRMLGTLRASVTRLPESFFVIDRFVRARRACNTERALGTRGGDALCAALTGVVVPLEARLQQPASWQAAAEEWKDAAQRILRRPSTLVWGVLALPSFLWFVIGGSPAGAGVQRQLSAGPGAAVVLALTFAAYAWLVWGLLASLRSWRRLLQAPLADSGVGLALSYLSGIGAVTFGALAVSRGGGAAPGSRALATEAWEAIKQASLLANLAAALWNSAFRPSPDDLHIPLPGTEDDYFTPTDVRRVAFNRVLQKLMGPLDPFHHVQFDTHSSDPHNKSELVGAISTAIAEMILGRFAFGGGAIRPGGATPKAPPGPAPQSDLPYANTEPAHAPPRARPDSLPYANTEPAGDVSPLANSVPAPRPQPAGRVPAGEGPFQTSPENRAWAENIPDHAAVRAMGGPEAFDRADAAARNAYNAGRSQGMNDAAARQASHEAWKEAWRKPRTEPSRTGPTPDTLPTTETLPIDDP